MATSPPSVATVNSYCAGTSCELDVSRAVALVSSRWAVPVLEALYFAAAPVRFRELQRRLSTISQKELTRQLTVFVHHSVVSRREQRSTRASVDYSLTERGMALLAQMDALGRWGKHLPTVTASSSALHAASSRPVGHRTRAGP
jgi:DNA-binding HxlR family transcriptional regulator